MKYSTHPLPGRVVRCLLFDLGNTLWPSQDPTTRQAIEQRVNAQTIASLGDLLRSKQLAPMEATALGQQVREAVRQQLREAVRRQPLVEPDGAVITMQVLYALGIPSVDRVVGQRVFEALNGRIPGARRLDGDSLSTLKTLKARGFQLGIVTNRHWSGASFEEELRLLGIWPLVDPRHVAISADVGWRKPHPELFLRVLRMLGTAPEETAMVGDSIRSDVGGGRRLGMLTVWKPKSSLWSEARAALAAARPAGERPANDAPGSIEDFLLAYTERRARRMEVPLYETRPDLLIEHISDLLALFTQAGTPAVGLAMR